MSASGPASGGGDGGTGDAPDPGPGGDGNGPAPAPGSAPDPAPGGTGGGSGRLVALRADPRARTAAKFLLATLVTAIVATTVPLVVGWIQAAFKDDEATPLDINVRYGHPFNEPGCGGSWIFPGARKPPAPGSAAVVPAWAHEHGGIDRYETDLVLTVQGRGPSAVNIQRVRVVELEKTPLPRAVVAQKGSCGGNVQERVFDVNLGDRPPRVLPVNPKTYEVEESDALSYYVTDRETEKFLVFAWTAKSTGGDDVLCSCVLRWKLAVDWSSHDREGTLVVDDHGKPFATAEGTWPSERSFAWWGEDSSGSWVDEDEYERRAEALE